jgi:hypothetical protein
MFAAGPSKPETPVDHSAQKTERLGWLSNSWMVTQKRSPEKLIELAMAVTFAASKSLWTA